MGYIAKLTDNDTSSEVRFGKTFTEVSSGVLKYRAKVKYPSNSGGGIKLFPDEANAGLSTSEAILINLGYSILDSAFALVVKDSSGKRQEFFTTSLTNDVWYILEIEVDFSNAIVYGRLYDENGSLLEEQSLSLGDITKLSVLTVNGVGGSQTGDIYFDDIELYHDTSVILSDDFEDGDVSDWNNYFGNGTFEAVQEEGVWYVDYNGRATKIRRGNSGSVTFTIIPNGSTDTINISVAENPSNLNVSIDPSSVSLDGSTNVTVTVDITVPSDTPYKPLFIVKLELAGSEKTDYVWIGVLPIDETASKVTIRQAEADETEYWVGASGTLNDTNKYMLYRYRTPTERGHTLVLAKSIDGVSWSDIKSFNKNDYGYESFEQSDIIKKPDDTYAVLYCAEYNGAWRIFKVETDDIENLTLPGTEVISTAKDPSIVYLSDKSKYIIALTNHSILTSAGDYAGVLYETTDLENLSMIGKIPENTWNKYNQHIGDLHYVDGYVVIFYDGNNENIFGIARMGIALLNPDTNEIVDLTADNPIWQSPNSDPAFRYVDIIYGNDYIVLIAEEGQDDGSHDLIAYYDGTLPQAPAFTITDYPSSVSGTPSEQKTINVTVENNGNADGDCTVRIRDHNNNIVAEQTQTITAGSSAIYSLQITLPSTTGTYTWTIEAYNVTNDTVDDTETFTVEVSEAPTKKKAFPWWIIPLLLGLGYIAFSGYKGEEESKE